MYHVEEGGLVLGQVVVYLHDPFPPPVLEEHVKTLVGVPNRQARGLQGNHPLTWVEGGRDKKNHMGLREERRATYLSSKLAHNLVSRHIDYNLAVKTTCSIRL